LRSIAPAGDRAERFLGEAESMLSISNSR